MDIRDEIWPQVVCVCSPHADSYHREYAHLKGLNCVFEKCDCQKFEAQEFFNGPDEIVEEGPSALPVKIVKATQIPVYGSDEYEQWLYGEGGYW